MGVAVDETGHYHGVGIHVDIPHLRICGSYGAVVACVDDISVLYHYQAVGMIVVAALCVVVKRRIGLECQYMASDAFERGAVGIYRKRGGVHGYDDVVLLTLQTLPDAEKLRRRLSPLFTLQVSTYRRPVLHGAALRRSPTPISRVRPDACGCIAAVSRYRA